MENASKALLIAGSVLVVILLIAVGVRTMNSTSEMSEQVDITSQSVAASTFNSKFLSYLSNSTSASEAKSLVSKVLTNNATVSSSSSFSAASHQIYLNLYPKNKASITHKWNSAGLQSVYQNISDGSKYNIYVTNCSTYSGGYYNGYVICISIKEL